MISSSSLSAFSASAISNGRLAVQPTAPPLTQQVRAQSATQAPTAAKPLPPLAPGQTPPRGSLLNLSV